LSQLNIKFCKFNDTTSPVWYSSNFKY